MSSDTPAGRMGATSARRRTLGAFYTPTAVADHLIAQLGPIDPAHRVLEPSGGDGAFVDALLAAGASPNQVTVWDIDPAAAASVRSRGVATNVRDSLLHPVVPEFDVIVGNPPYLNKASEYVRSHRKALADTYPQIGASETYAMFTVMALRALRRGGRLSLLISDTFLTLGLHERFRRHLLEHTVDQVTLLPPDTFPDASVRTAILTVTKAPAAHDHHVRFVDHRADNACEFIRGTTHHVPQHELAANAGSTFAFTPAGRRGLALVRSSTLRLLDIADGGLGMYARDNTRNVAVVIDRGVPRAPAGRLGTVDVDVVDGTTWRAYHKRGGTSRWWRPAEHAVRWDTESQSMYDFMPASRCGRDTEGNDRPGVILSGIATQLSARLATPGAMWESNKCFGLFPKDPAAHPPEFLLAVLNSSVYDQVAKALNHTVSFQVRDLKRMPMLPFSEAEVRSLAAYGASAVEATKQGSPVPAEVVAAVESVVTAAADRALAGAP